MAPQTYGGAVKSCALVDVKPMLRMICELQPIIRDGVRPEDDCLQVELPVGDHLLENGPINERLLLSGLSVCADAAIRDVGEVEELGLLRGQPGGFGWRVCHEEEARSTNAHGEHAFEEETVIQSALGHHLSMRHSHPSPPS